MSDVFVLVAVVAFFALAVGLLQACERAVGAEAPANRDEAEPLPPAGGTTP